MAALVFLGFYFVKARDFYNSSSRRYGESFYQRDEDLGFHLKPNIRYYSPGPPAFTLLTDKRGVRVPDNEPSPERVELVTSGCSFSFGVGNNYEKTFTGILAKNLSLRAANISVPGTGTLSAFLRSKRYVALRPRVVVYGLIEDHLLRNVYPCALFGGGICRPNVYLEWENGDWKNKIRSELWNERWIEGAEQMTLSHPFGWKDLAWVFELDWQALWRRDANGVNAAALSRLPSDGQAKAMTWAVQAWQRLAEEAGFELVVVFIPSMSKPNTLPPVIARVFESLAGRSHLHFLDTSPYFLRHRLAHPEESFCVSSGDCHPNELAHGIIATALEPKLKALLQSRPKD